MFKRLIQFFMIPDGAPGGAPPAPVPPVPPSTPAPAPAPVAPPATPARTQEPVADAPWITMFPKSVRGDDMLTWGATGEEMITNVRAAMKENAALKSQMSEFSKGVPANAEDYTFSIPEEAKPYISTDDLKAFQKLAHSKRLPMVTAQELMAFEAKRTLDARKAYESYVNEKKKETLDGLRAEFKDKTDALVASALQVVEALGGAELREEMEKTAIGNNPRLIRAFIKVAPLFTERGPGGALPPGGGQNLEGEVNYRQIYPKSFSHMTGKA